MTVCNIRRDGELRLEQLDGPVALRGGELHGPASGLLPVRRNRGWDRVNTSVRDVDRRDAQPRALARARVHVRCCDHRRGVHLTLGRADGTQVFCLLRVFALGIALRVLTMCVFLQI